MRHLRRRRAWTRLAAWTLSVVLGIVAFGAEDEPAPQKTDPELAAISQLLDIAWSGDKQAPQAARQAYDSLRPQVKDRRRLHYAYGVATLKMKRYPAATQAFLAATQESPGFEFSPWKGLIWTELTLKHYDDGLNHIEALARLIADDDFAGSDEESDRIAVWLGQTMSALTKIVAAPKVLQRLDEVDARLREMWSDELRDAYQSGRDYADTQYGELMSDLKQAKDDAQSREELARVQKQQNLQKDIGAAEKEREQLKKSAEQLQKQFEQRLLQIDKQLARLERDYSYLTTRAASVMRSMAMIQAQLQLTQQRSASNPPNGVRSPYLGSLDDPVQRLDFLLGMYQRELEMTMARSTFVVQQAMQGLQLREQTARHVQQTVGDLERKDADLQKWQDRLSQAGENLKKAKIKATSPSVRQKRQQAKSLNTYLEFDPEWERIRITEPPNPS
jgi:hypothetical protein